MNDSKEFPASYWDSIGVLDLSVRGGVEQRVGARIVVVKKSVKTWANSWQQVVNNCIQRAYRSGLLFWQS